MTGDSEKELRPEDNLLNRLIKSIRGAGVAGFTRPDDDAITAYLMGTAAESQARAVMEALQESAAFRREILAMAEDMDALASTDVVHGKKEIAGPECPGLHEFLKGRDRGVPGPPRSEMTWGRFFWWRALRSFAPAAAVASILVLIITWIASFTPEAIYRAEPAVLSLASEQVERSLLISNVTREAAAAAVGGYPSSREAALAEFRFLLEYEGGTFHPKPLRYRTEPTGAYRWATILLLDSADSVRSELRAPIPISGTRAPYRLEAWFLGLPGRDLFVANIVSDSTLIRWDEKMGFEGVATFTYPSEDGYLATEGFTLDLQ
jgi:hypothetical protein